MVQFQHQIPEKQSHRKNIINSNSSKTPKKGVHSCCISKDLKDLLRTFSSPH